MYENLILLAIIAVLGFLAILVLITGLLRWIFKIDDAIKLLRSIDNKLSALSTIKDHTMPKSQCSLCRKPLERQELKFIKNHLLCDRCAALVNVKAG